MFKVLGDILPYAAAAYGSKTALIIEDRKFSFSELETLSNRVANGLVGVGVGLLDEGKTRARLFEGAVLLLDH